MPEGVDETPATPIFQPNITGRLLLHAAREFSELLGQRLKTRQHAHLRLRHADLIVSLDWEGTRITTLAERAGMTKQAMGQLVKELEKAGYVERHADVRDRRAILVKLTATGTSLLHDIQQVVGEIEAEYAAVVGAVKLDAVRTVLAALVAYSRRMQVAE